MNIRKKLLVGFVVMTLLVSLVGLTALYVNSNMDSHLEEMSDTYWKGTKSAMDFRTNVYAIHGFVMCYINDEDEALEEIAEFKEVVEVDLAEMKASGLFTSAVLDGIEADTSSFYGIIDGIVVAKEAQDMVELDEKVEDLDAQVVVFTASVLTVVNDAKGEMDHHIMSLETQLEESKVLLLVAMVSSVVFGLIFTAWLSNNIASPIRMMTKAADEISSGNKEVEFLNIQRSDEIGDLGESFDRMINSVKLAMEMMKE